MHPWVACLVNLDLLNLVADQSFVVVKGDIATTASYDLARLTGGAFERLQVKHSLLQLRTNRQQLESAHSIRVAQ